VEVCVFFVVQSTTLFKNLYFVSCFKTKTLEASFQRTGEEGRGGEGKGGEEIVHFNLKMLTLQVNRNFEAVHYNTKFQ